MIANSATPVLRVSGRSGPIDAVVNVPGSKSVANRILVCALLADGVSRVAGLPGGDDVAAMVRALRSLDRCEDESGVLVVSGGLRDERFLADRVDCELAGTTSRFLTAVAALQAKPTVVDGRARLRERPMFDLHQALESLGVDILAYETPGHLPVRVARGSLRGGEVSVRGDASSQFLSALMMIAPLLPGGLRIAVEGDLVSRPYVEMTGEVMSRFGVNVTYSPSVVTVPECRYRSVEIRTEPDYSSAAFPIAAALLAGGRMRIPGLGEASLQGDDQILDIARQMGATVTVAGDVVVEVPSVADRPVLAAIDVDMAHCSDLVPAVAVAASAASGTSRIRGVGFIRNKESDRLGDLTYELRKAGVAVTETTDGLEITGGGTLRPARFATHDDHRLAMALSLLALNGSTVEVEDPAVVNKSWPSYFQDMADVLGASISGQ